MISRTHSSGICKGTILAAAMIASFLLPWRASAQGSRVAAALDGTVKDQSGAIVAGAPVVLREPYTNQQRTIMTDAEGSFHAEALPTGSYEVRVNQPGFAPYRQTGNRPLSPGTDSLTSSSFCFSASYSEKIAVNAQPESDRHHSNVRGFLRGRRAHRGIAGAQPKLSGLRAAGPGRFGSAAITAGQRARSPLAGSGFFVRRHARAEQHHRDRRARKQRRVRRRFEPHTELSPEIVQEFQVVNNARLSAESGGASGRIPINVITRSGTNDIHGDAFLFAQDAVLNARDPFENRPGRAILSTVSRRIGDRRSRQKKTTLTFYYAAVEQEHNRGQSGSEIDPAAAAAINSILAVGAFPSLASRRITTDFFPISREETEAAGRLDQRLTKNTSLMLRYAFTNNQEAGDAFNTSGLEDASARGSSFIADHSLSGSLTTVYGSSAVGDLRFQAATRRAVLRTNDSIGPEIDIAGIADFGRPYAGPGQRRENHFQAVYTYTRTRGKHTWKAGGVISRVSLRASAGDGFGGVYLFNTLQGFLAARPDQFRQSFGGTAVAFPVTVTGAFLQDHWPIAPRLTVDLGVRYDFERLPGEFNQDADNFSPRIGLAWSPSSRWVFRAPASWNFL